MVFKCRVRISIIGLLSDKPLNEQSYPAELDFSSGGRGLHRIPHSQVSSLLRLSKVRGSIFLVRLSKTGWFAGTFERCAEATFRNQRSIGIRRFVR